MVKKVFDHFILFLLIIILLIVCYLKYYLKVPVVKIGGYGMLIVATGSMDPTIEEKELIIIKQCENYDVDDIITYSDSHGNLITHRILEIDSYGFMSKGDRNSNSDKYLGIENIHGKVVFHSKILGIFILYYLKIILFIYSVILVILFFKPKFRKEREDEKESK